MIRNIVILLASATLVFSAETYHAKGCLGKSPTEVAAMFGRKVDMDAKYSGPFFEWDKTIDYVCPEDYKLTWNTLLNGRYKIGDKYTFAFRAKFWKPINIPSEPWRCYSAEYTLTDEPPTTVGTTKKKRKKTYEHIDDTIK